MFIVLGSLFGVGTQYGIPSRIFIKGQSSSQFGFIEVPCYFGGGSPIYVRLISKLVHDPKHLVPWGLQADVMDNIGSPKGPST